MTKNGGRLPVVDRAAAWAPASLSNLGPGFDVLGIAIGNWGDRVEARISDTGKIRINYSDSSLWSGTVVPNENTAGVSAGSVLERLGWRGGIDLVIEKQIVPGSGVGSSAASSVAAAWAVNLLFGAPLQKEEIVDAVLLGESVASGEPHGDNALPCLFGGIVMVSSVDATVFRLIGDGKGLFLSVILPDVRIMTRDARGMLPEFVPLKDAVDNASNLAFLVHALGSGDWRQAGRIIMSDRIVEPVRSGLIPCYQGVRHAAAEEGAFGCALSGSGPAMFALSGRREDAERILEAMINAASKVDVDSKGVVTETDTHGARAVVRTGSGRSFKREG